MSPTRFVKVDNLIFVRCKQRDLIIGKKYMIIREVHFDKHREIMYGTIIVNDLSMITYICTNVITNVNTIVNTKTIDTLMNRTIFLKLYSSKHTIQQAMELRATNLILQNIIGDKMFNY